MNKATISVEKKIEQAEQKSELGGSSVQQKMRNGQDRLPLQIQKLANRISVEETKQREQRLYSTQILDIVGSHPNSIRTSQPGFRKFFPGKKREVGHLRQKRFDSVDHSLKEVSSLVTPSRKRNRLQALDISLLQSQAE